MSTTNVNVDPSKVLVWSCCTIHSVADKLRNVNAKRRMGQGQAGLKLMLIAMRYGCMDTESDTCLHTGSSASTFPDLR